jgi:hypothetical protein
MPANPGVNPALTITALAEHAMAQVPTCCEAIALATLGNVSPVVTSLSSCDATAMSSLAVKT